MAGHSLLSDTSLISPFPPIAEYAFLSDCETCALVAPSGAVEWMCLPRFDGPSVFGALLDRDAGTFRLGPADTMVPAARRYLPGTMVLETSWGTRQGWLIVRDVLLIGPWHDTEERSSTHRRPLARLARPRHVPRPPVARAPAALRAHAQRPLLRADRRDGRRRHHVAARVPRRRAQLGLPLLVGARLHVHALGPALARLR